MKNIRSVDCYSLNEEIDYTDKEENYIPYNVLGFAGRLTYGYDDRYLFEFNIGYNGSEQFSPNKRFGVFPAVSGAWVASNEKFWKENDVVTSLKLRASYGKVGNDKMGNDRFLYLNHITMNNSGLLGSLAQGNKINEGLLGNVELTWETALKQNYGVDIQLFKDLALSIDAFKEHRTNILISRGMVPSLQGVPLTNVPRANLGIVDNKGFEVELTYNKTVTKDLSLMFRSNFSYAKNKVVFSDEPTLGSDYAYQYEETGFSIGQQMGMAISTRKKNLMII